MASVRKQWIFKLLVFFMIVLCGFLTLTRVFLTMLTHPLSWFRKKDRTDTPDCLLDSSLGNHEYMSANGVKFHYVVKGSRTKPLMLMLHGFPEFWFSWRHQMKEFSNDYRVIAIDMRGYGDTQRPPNKKDYTFDKLRQDIVELVKQFGYAKCTLVAHDWGGVIAWRVAQRNPECVQRLIIMNCPHPKVYAKAVSGDWRQILKSWYIFMFQLPWLPEFVLSINDYSNLVASFTKPPMGALDKDAFSPEVLEAYKYTFSKPGALTAPINYYRCMLSSSDSLEKEKEKKKQVVTNGKEGEERKRTAPMIKIPTLLIWGDCDAALGMKMADMHTSVATNITIKHIPNCSHWVQQEKPEVVNTFMKEFLNLSPTLH